MPTARAYAFLLAAFLTTPAYAQQCAPYSAIASMLDMAHGEAVVARAPAGDGSTMFELWLNPTTGTWSAIIVRPVPHVACPLASGTDLEFVRPIVPGRDG